MTREEKKEIIDGLTEKFRENPFFYVTDASGFTVAQVMLSDVHALKKEWSTKCTKTP